MTIGIGFNSSEGVVLGADRQLTRVGINKFFDSKMFTDVKEERALAMVCADDISLAREVRDKLLQYRIDSIEAAKTAFGTILNDMGRLHIDLPLQLLPGVSVAD